MVNIRHYREFHVCTIRDHQLPTSMADTDTLTTAEAPRLWGGRSSASCCWDAPATGTFEDTLAVSHKVKHTPV